MPNRILKTVHGNIGSTILIVGIYMLGLGITWLIYPTNTRDSGVEWVNESSLPIYGLTAHHVAWWWIISGMAGILGGMFSNNRYMERLGIFATTFAPMLVALLFLGAWVDDVSHTAIISFWSYSFVTAIVLREVSVQHPGVSKKSLEEITGEMEVIS